MPSLLFGDQAPVADGIVFQIHTIEEILAFGEEEYFSSLSVFLADPFDYMYPLFQQGIDYEDVTEFQLFVSLMSQLRPEVISFFFGDTLPLKSMVLAHDKELDEVVLIDPENPERVFNSATLRVLADVIRKIHFIKHEIKKAANKTAKQYFLEQAARRARRRRPSDSKPILEPLIVALVNTPEFPYNYQNCKQVTIYQFLSSVHQIPKRLSWGFVMHGVHVGMIDSASVKWKEIDWMSGPSGH